MVSDDDRSFFVAILLTWESGLPYDLMIESNGASRNDKQSPAKCKIKVGERWISVSISATPIILGDEEQGSIPYQQEVFDWIATHEDTLLKHWNGKLSDLEALCLLCRCDFQKT